MFSVFYGRMGDAAVATMGVCNTINDLVWVAIFALMNACAILVGKTLGSVRKGMNDSADDDDDDEDDDAAEAMQEKLRAEAEKKKKEKEANKKVEKSLLVIHIKPFDEETDLKALFEKIRATEVKGCKWGETCNIKPLAFGINFLEISCVIEDDVCSEDDVIDAIMQFEDEVQSTETVSFNKIS